MDAACSYLQGLLYRNKKLVEQNSLLEKSAQVSAFQDCQNQLESKQKELYRAYANISRLESSLESIEKEMVTVRQLNHLYETQIANLDIQIKEQKRVIRRLQDRLDGVNNGRH